jgi:hypothetical protein
LSYEEGRNGRLNITHAGALKLTFFAQYYDQTEDNEMNGTSGMHRRDENCVQRFRQKVARRGLCRAGYGW